MTGNAALPHDSARTSSRDSCRTATRQATTVDLIDPAEFLVNGRTGIDEVDRFIMTENPDGLSSPSTVLSPETYLARRARR